MRKRIAIRLLILSLSLAVLALGMQAVSHSHGISHDEDHCTCQVCHVGHVAISQPTVQAQVRTPLLVARFAPAEASSLLLESAHITSVPRAPPESSDPA